MYWTLLITSIYMFFLSGNSAGIAKIICKGISDFSLRGERRITADHTWAFESTINGGL